MSGIVVKAKHEANWKNAIYNTPIGERNPATLKLQAKPINFTAQVRNSPVGVHDPAPFPRKLGDPLPHRIIKRAKRK